MGAQTTEQSQEIVTRALENMGDIATLPEVTIRVMEAVENAEGSTTELYEIIKRDPALSARILSVVNSAFYGLPGQVATVDRAIVLLGRAAVKDIAVASSVGSMFEVPRKPGQFDPRELWKHSLAVAVTARHIRTICGATVSPDEIFLAGLIHDLGLLVELQTFPEQMTELIARAQSDEVCLGRLEAEVIGATHEQFGEALTARRRFPALLRAAAGAHHDPERFPEEARHVGRILRCADILCGQEGLGLSATVLGEEISAELLADINIGEDQLTALRERLPDEIAQAEIVFGS